MESSTATLAHPQLATNDGLAAMGSLLAALYRRPIDAEQASRLRALEPNDPDDFFMRDEGCRRGLALLRAHFDAGEAALATASADFHQLFVGPLKLAAAPWSSVYLDLGSLFGPTALAVRAVFARNGFEIPEGTREPSDHIAYELAFVAEMHRGLGAAAAREDRDAQTRAFDEGRAFPADYLLPWSDRFLDAVERGARTDAYRGLADLTRGHLRMERTFFGA